MEYRIEIGPVRPATARERLIVALDLPSAEDAIAMVDRLKEDHENAQLLAKGLAKLKGVNIDLEKVETNMVMLDTRPLGMKAADIASELSKRNVKASIYGLYTMRLVTNKDATRDDILFAIEAFEDLVASLVHKG